jgi:hypothetical protein
MKAILFMLATVAGAADPPVEFMGVPLGLSADRVVSIADKIKGASQPEVAPGRISYKGGGRIAGWPVRNFVFHITNGRFTKGTVTFEPSLAGLKQIREIQRMLVAKYGTPTATSGDSKDATAIWRLPASGERKPIEITCLLTSRITDRTTKIVYQQLSSVKLGSASECR